LRAAEARLPLDLVSITLRNAILSFLWGTISMEKGLAGGGYGLKNRTLGVIIIQY